MRQRRGSGQINLLFPTEFSTNEFTKKIYLAGEPRALGASSTTETHRLFPRRAHEKLYLSG